MEREPIDGVRESDARILFDCTATLRDGLNTGIQRVVRNLLRHSQSAAERLGIECHGVIHSRGEWFRVPSELALDQPTGQVGSRTSCDATVDWALRLRARLRKALVPRSISRFVQNRVRYWDVSRQHVRETLRSNDLLLLTDASWNQPEPLPLDAVRSVGGRVGMVVYDLTPLHFPQFRTASFPGEFEAWLRGMLPRVDFCVGISRAVRDDVERYLAEQGGAYPHLAGRVGWFPLGVKLDQANPNAPIRPSLKQVFEGGAEQPPVLIVCTLEPRKNHALLLDAFDRLRHVDPNLRLCLVGSPGWCYERLVQRIQSHPEWQRRLFWFSGLSDTELDYCYRHSRTFVFPSFAEGVGLPIIEALHYGLQVFASDIQAHREVGQDFCEFFDPHDVEQLTGLLRNRCRPGIRDGERSRTAFVPPDWTQSTIRLWEECLRLGRADTGPSLRTPPILTPPVAAAVKTPRLFLDCSMTASSTSHAGIQRVVRNVARCATVAAADHGLAARTVVFQDGYWRDVPRALERLSVQATESATDRQETETRRNTFTKLAKRVGERLYKIFYPRSLTRAARTTVGNLLGLGAPMVDFQPGDILLLLDGSWLMSEQPRLDVVRRAGARIGLVAYDLLPLQPTGFMLPKSTRMFSRWMRHVIPRVDFVVAISRAVRDEYRAWIRADFPNLANLESRVSWFPLGFKLDRAAVGGQVRPEVRRAFDPSRPTYLKVCTIEPRKNHSLVLDAFERVWRERPDARLCFVGRRGWLCDDLVARMVGHPRWGQSFFWFSDLTDTELSYCYEHSRGNIFASLAEGYGLPIVESLGHGLPTFASDIPVHREVGGDFCAWFAPGSSESLASLLLGHLLSNAYPATRPIAEFQPPSWEEGTSSLVKECRRLAEGDSMLLRRVA